MAIVSSLLSAVSSVASPYLLYIKLAAIVGVGLLIGGLYWYGQHEAEAVTSLNQQLGVAQKTIADDQANIKELETANSAWSAAFATFENKLKDQGAALKSAEAAKDAINDELQAAKLSVEQDTSAGVVRLDGDVSTVVCLLNRATGGGPSNCPALGAAAAPTAAAPGATKP